MDDVLPDMQPPIEDDLSGDDNELFDDENEEETYEEKAPPAVLGRTHSLRAFLAIKTNLWIAEQCRQVIQYMVSLGLDLTLFLYHISWTNPEATVDPVIQYARSVLMWSEELPTILRNWHRPPREHLRGVRTKAVRAAMDSFAQDLVVRRINRDMRALGPLMKSPNSEFSEEALLAVEFQELIPRVQELAPTFWKLCRATAHTPRQAAENTKKSDPDMVCLLPLLRQLYYMLTICILYHRLSS